MSSVRFRYQTVEFDDTDIHVKTLRDKQQFADEDGVAASLGISSAAWPMFGVIWPSGEVLARLMYHYEIEGKKILEVGCGIGLASLVLNHRLANITATDRHPEAARLLSENAALNEGRHIPFIRTAWRDPCSELGDFDLIVASDVLYEQEHAEQLAEFVDSHARLHCDVIVVDPGRRQQSRFRLQMTNRGYVYSEAQLADANELTQPFAGRILHFHK